MIVKQKQEESRSLEEEREKTKMRGNLKLTKHTQYSS